MPEFPGCSHAGAEITPDNLNRIMPAKGENIIRLGFTPGISA